MSCDRRKCTMADIIPPGQIRVGMRVLVVTPPDEHCDREVMWGAGVVTYTAERTEVIFDSGGGGMFPNHWIRRGQVCRDCGRGD